MTRSRVRSTTTTAIRPTATRGLTTTRTSRHRYDRWRASLHYSSSSSPPPSWLPSSSLLLSASSLSSWRGGDCGDTGNAGVDHRTNKDAATDSQQHQHQQQQQQQEGDVAFVSQRTMAMRANNHNNYNNNNSDGESMQTLLQPMVLFCQRPPHPPHDDHDDGYIDDDEYDDDSTASITTAGTTKGTAKILIVMDAFCSYHGLYLIERARSLAIPGLVVVSVLSDYVRHYLVSSSSSSSSPTSSLQQDGGSKNDGDDGGEQQLQQQQQWQAMAVPKTPQHAMQWKKQIAKAIEQQQLQQQRRRNQNLSRPLSNPAEVSSEHAVTTNDDDDDMNGSSGRDDPCNRHGHRQELDHNLQFVAVYCESDSGLAEAEALRDLLNVTCTDIPPVWHARRDKYHMHEQLRLVWHHRRDYYRHHHGDHHHGNDANNPKRRVVQQQLCHSAKQARQFAQQLLQLEAAAAPPPAAAAVIVKPVRGVASESVYRCESLEQVEQAFEAIVNTTVFGAHEQQASSSSSLLHQQQQEQTHPQPHPHKHEAVLVQEYLVGTEYALDVVSRNGQHKIAAIWRYDKRSANGAAFCYYQTALVFRTSNPKNKTKMKENSSNSRVGCKLQDGADSDDDDGVIDAIVEHTQAALDALGIRWGLSHNEIIVTEATNEPVLVEVNCRQHNMDFAPLTMACIGYNALDMTLAAFLGDDDDWDDIPDEPTLQRAHGCMVHLVNSQRGRFVRVRSDFIDLLSSRLESILEWHIYDHIVQPGAWLEPTVDIRTDAGWVQLVHPDLNVLQRDYERIVECMPNMFVATDMSEEYA